MSNQILLDNWYIVGKIDDIKPGSKKKQKLFGEELILWRGNSPESPVLAWQDRCIHRGVSLNLGKIVGDRLTCMYHGWEYDQSGKCVIIPSLPGKAPPASFCVNTYKCKECFGYVWVSLGNPTQNIPPFPEWDNLEYRKLLVGPYHFRSSGFRVIENSFDLSHLPFAHSSSLGDPSHPTIGDYKVEFNQEKLTIGNLSQWHRDPDCTGTGNGSLTNYPFIDIYPHLKIHALKQIYNTSRTMHWVMNVTPIEEEECLVWVTFIMNYGQEIPESEMQAIQDKIAREDALLLESQRPACLPLVPSNNIDRQFLPEVHVKCDRASVAYRRWLKDLGITFGVC
ncbi:MAG: aromatic ring-hydroxylating dioxygenase subunit alpha [Moorea sp. SIO2I5]|nr:aromatic ring-hydroxylating dioxygenase subunit alpha [Moorena sp. SIO2I5]